MDQDLSKHQRYDGVTVALHWLTALLVITLFGTAMAWTYAPRDWGLRWLSGFHVSLGVALAGIVVARLVWRATAGRRLHDATANRTLRLLSKAVHLTLYGLLILQIGLGFATEWLGSGSVSFFGLFTIPSPFAASRALGNQLENTHGLVAWTIMILVGGHAAAALWHRYIVGDAVLARMTPSRSAS